MKLTLRAAVIAAIFAGMTVVTACSKSDQQDPAAAKQQMPPAVVDVQTVSLGAIPLTTEFSGRVAALETSEVRPQVTGIVDEVLFHEGSFVQAGQPLYRINTDNYASAINAGRASVANAQASAQNARAVHAQSQANLETRVANLAQAKAGLAQAQASLAQAKADLARLQGLVEANAVSQQFYDQAVTTVRNAEANVQAAEANVQASQAGVRSAQATVEQAKAGIGSADAAINSARANLSASELDLSRTVVRAPISGRIGISAVTKGALVSANQASALASISRTDMVFVDISQSSSDILRLRQQISEGKAVYGSPEVQIVLEDGQIYPLTGQLALADAKVDEATGSVTIRAVFPNPDGLLIPGMYVNAQLAQTVVQNAVLLPQTAITRTPQGKTQVYVVNAEKKIEVREVQVAGTHNGKWVVNGGLQDGDQVVVMGGAKVKPEQEVQVRVLPSSQMGQAPESQEGQDVPMMAPPSLQAPKTQEGEAHESNNAPTKAQ